MDQPLYHGTCRQFDAFLVDAPAPEGLLWSHTRALGTFFTGSAKVAAYFTLKPDVTDAGFDSDAGSHSLLEDPWQYDAQPFDEGAQVLTCQVSAERLYALPLMRWMELCEEADENRMTDMRLDYQSQGFDGILIEAAEEGEEHYEYGRPCAEYDTITVVLFDPSSVTITERGEPGQAWVARELARKPARRR